MIEMAFFHTNFMLQTSHEDDHENQLPTSLPPIIPSCNPQEFHGVASSLLGKRSSMTFSTGFDVCEDHTNNINGHDQDELSDDGSLIGEKKRRLNIDQVKTLEKSFEIGNKLEPERKLQLARALGLQPRQIAIWFQNRRARWKTKQLERDYDVLRKQFEAIKAENDALQAQNKKLHAEILALKTREPTEISSINLNKETEGSCSNRSSDQNSSEIKLDISTIESPSLSKIANRSLFPSTTRPIHLFQDSSRPEIQGPKLDHSVKEESLMCNMFCGVDDQTGFWPWFDQQNFN